MQEQLQDEAGQMTVAVDTNNTFPGYRITEQIYLGSRTIVYRGIRELDQEPVVIKLMRNEFPSFNELTQFRNQYSITKNLNLPGIIKTYSLENYRNGYAIVMEDFGGISLKEWGRTDITKFDLTYLEDFFGIAIQIASALNELHCHRIIHKDIKPANILIHPATKEIKIIDFSIASLLPREIQFITNPNILEGTLAYISPEQTGRMNRGIDYRTDFYSLGITFFELLTGQLPFTSNNQMELVYCHIAKQPPKASSINSQIPPILSDIISKLMAKNSEERYQSALGLKYDLEICKQQLQETGKIDSFNLATKDISDRFLIPEKLYGRQREVETLLAAFERVTGGTTEMILIAGDPGIGKTAVVNEVHKPIVRQRSYFIQGKFDQFQRDIPFSAWVEAFRDLIRQILSESDTQIQQWKTKILSALGDQAQIIINVIPQLEQIIGEQPPIVELSGNAAENRFNLLFQRFVQIFTSKEYPLVIFLDDLQWADIASLKFIEILMNSINTTLLLNEREQIEENQGGLLLIGTYRNNEISKNHSLNLIINEVTKNGKIVNFINLKNLNQNDLNNLVMETLHCSEITSIPLTQMVFAKTKGNPFFTNQFLKSLHADGLIKFQYDLGEWQYNLAQIMTLSLKDDVVEFMILQIKKLPVFTQKVLKLAACIGNQFDLKTLATIYEKNVIDTASDLWAALHEGLILAQSDDYKLFCTHPRESTSLPILNSQLSKYSFVHDRVRQAAYSLISDENKPAVHLKIGTLLLNETTVKEREEIIFSLVKQFNLAVDLVTEKNQRDELAEMNLIAGRRAMASTAYAAAMSYLKIGIELLKFDGWENKYELTLSLHEAATEAAYLAGELEISEQFIEIVLQRAKTVLDKVKVYEVKIKAHGTQGKLLEAVNITLDVLKQLDLEIPENPNHADIHLAIAEIQSTLNGRRIEDLIDLPEMTDAKALAVMLILTSAIGFIYQAVPQLYPIFAFKQINLSLKYGNTLLSAFAYVAYGVILCNVLEQIEFGYQFGKLGVSILDKFNSKEVKAKSILGFNIAIRHKKEHTKKILKSLLEIYSIGLEAGDLEYASYSIFHYCCCSYFTSMELSMLEKEIKTYSYALQQIKQESILTWNAMYRQIALNLLTNVENPCRLIGEAYDEEKIVPLYLQANNVMGLLHLYLNKLHLCYLFQDFDQAIENANLAQKYLEGATGQIVVCLFHFYDSLARLAVYPEADVSKQEKILAKVALNQEKMQLWADHAPMNYLHKYYLVKAERHRVIGEYVEAMDNYDRAIALAKEHGYINEEAIANELAGKFYLQLGKQKIAQLYLVDAYYCYVRWGAKTKIDDLTKRYSQFFVSILHQDKQSLHNIDKNISTSPAYLVTQSHHQTVIGSHNTISDSLDLNAVIKVSQALFGEIELKQLLSTLMEIVMENAGASKCALILSKNENLDLNVTAVFSSSTSICTEFPSVNLESSCDVPITLINYVKRTREVCVIDDVKLEQFLASDHYIINQQPKSLLCIPIINQGKFIGILYLENNLTTAAFTNNRIELLKLITTQAAISLENAILYEDLMVAKERLEEYSHTLEDKVEERTQELNENNQKLQQVILELKNAQSHLIQSEKMSSLGQMVAGIAHEINNPINFIHGNITHASDYVQDLLDLISIYQQEYPHTSDVIAEKAEEIDLDFLLEDLPKLLNSMKIGTSRIRNIVLGLRNFSRLDEAEMKPVDIHEGIDNTLMILEHRLKARSDRLEIQVIKEYGQLPEVACYAGQLNQVFMNILSNAIDALEEGIAKKQSSSLQIRIYTELTDNQVVKIKISDNALGIKPEVQQKIFDPFFTTKPTGSGTGLGLAISYQIVVDKHKGKLICDSNLGKGTEFIIEIPLQAKNN